METVRRGSVLVIVLIQYGCIISPGAVTTNGSLTPAKSNRTTVQEPVLLFLFYYQSLWLEVQESTADDLCRMETFGRNIVSSICYHTLNRADAGTHVKMNGCLYDSGQNPQLES
jgi:hypothetical protein